MSKKGSTDLRTLFFQDEKLYNEEYQRRFNSESAIHLNFFIKDCPAFICPNDDIYKTMLLIERTDKEVNRLCGILPGVAVKQLIQKSLIDEIVLTNKIEGVSSTRKEIGEILSGLSHRNKNQRFYGLVNKYNLLRKGEKINIRTCEDIRKIYDEILWEEIKSGDKNDLPDGKIFRKGTVSVYSPTEKEIHGGLYPEEKIISAMKSALKFLWNEEVDILLRISVFHYLFGYIHPFYDGNGRVSRFISSYLLSGELNRLMGYRLSYTIRENIKEYYNAFKTCNDIRNKGDLTPFAETFLSIICEAETNLCKSLKEKEKLLTHYHGLINSLPCSKDSDVFNLYFLFIQAALFSDIGISKKEATESMKISPYLFSQKIEKIPSELLIVNKQKNTRFYMLNLDKMEALIKNPL